MYEHLSRPEQDRLLEDLNRRYWDAMDFLGSVTMERATLMNDIQASMEQENQQENQNGPSVEPSLPACEAYDSAA